MSSRSRSVLTAATSDRRHLYEEAVQCPEAELDFVARWFKRLRGRPCRHIREDFCGAGLTASEWVKRHADNTSLGLDIDAAALAWGTRTHLDPLPPHQRRRVSLLNRNVLRPPHAALPPDAVLAMNFSWSVFKTRDLLKAYFAAAHSSLAKDGILFMDIHGGYESMKELTERRRCKGFTYVWEQAKYDPISSDMLCYIHFDFKKGPMMKRAFTYRWRLWSIPEVRELLAEAGFASTTVYWEGENKHGNGTGEYHPRRKGVADASFVCMISALK